MAGVAEQQLQCVSARRERDLGFGLSCAKMQMVEVRGDGLRECWQCGVNDQVVMTCVGLVHAGGRNSHADQAEANHGLERDVVAIVRIDEVDLGVWSLSMPGARRRRRRRRRRGSTFCNADRDAFRHHRR